MPQGGVDNGEDYEQAMRRELHEETSIKSIEIVKIIEKWLIYDLPPSLLGKIWKGRFRGQDKSGSLQNLLELIMK